MGTTRCGPARQPTWLVRGSVARFTIHLPTNQPTYPPILRTLRVAWSTTCQPPSARRLANLARQRDPSAPTRRPG